MECRFCFICQEVGTLILQCYIHISIEIQLSYSREETLFLRQSYIIFSCSYSHTNVLSQWSEKQFYLFIVAGKQKCIKK